MGCKAVLIPSENARHLEEVPAEVREQLSIHLVNHMDEVIQHALTRMPAPRKNQAVEAPALHPSFPDQNSPASTQ